MPIKSLGGKVLQSIISPSIKEAENSYSCKVVARHFANGSSQVKGIEFDQSYIPVSHADSFIINIDIAAIHRLTASILYISNAFKNTNVPIHERVCISTPPYYLNWF